MPLHNKAFYPYFLRYILSGIINTSFSYSIFAFIYYFLGNLNYPPSERSSLTVFLSFSISTFSAFVMQKRFVWKDKFSDKKYALATRLGTSINRGLLRTFKQFILYALYALLIVNLNIALLNFASLRYEIPVLISQAVFTIFYALIGFFITKKLFYKKNQTK